jgi:anti-anti-sigma factor
MFEIEVQADREDYQLVRLRGQLRNEAAPDIEEKLHPLVGVRGSAIVVDISGVTEIDSSGLSHLISLGTHARLSQARMVLTGPTPFVAGVLSTTRLDTWFDMADDVADAERRLKSQA